MKVVIFGATGMVGAGVLAECLIDSRIDSIIAVGRSATGVSHAKLHEIVRPEITALDDVRDVLAGSGACFFCVGVSSFRMDEETYRRLTYDLTIAVAEAMASISPGIRFVYVSGEATDSSERGRVMWARIKGATENRLLAMNAIDAFMMRPGFIQPDHGVRSKTRIYRIFYALTAPLFPVLRRLLPAHVTTSRNVGRAMIELALHGGETRILENADINALGVQRH
jgi:uncharacterized protein YbjT (DUF2867 family)